MTEEMAEGRFSADGTYIANDKDPEESHDTWLSGISKAEMKQAREAKKRMEEKSRKEKTQDIKSRDDCLLGILDILEKGESVQAALKRLGRRVEKEAPKEKRKVTKKDTHSDSMEVDSTVASVPRVQAQQDPLRAEILLLTTLASTLLSEYNEMEIYSLTYEDILQMLRDEGAVRRDWVPASKRDEVELEPEPSGLPRRSVISRPTATQDPPQPDLQEPKVFFYRFKGTRETYGPFGLSEMLSWFGAGFFGDDGVNIDVRKDGDVEWGKWEEVVRV
jgi:CD2 antigen cytoplasmic tail-binding protein 2